MGQFLVEDEPACVDERRIEGALGDPFWVEELPDFEVFVTTEEHGDRILLEVTVLCDPAGRWCEQMGPSPLVQRERVDRHECPDTAQLALNEAATLIRRITDGEELARHFALELGATGGSGPAAPRGQLAVTRWSDLEATRQWGATVRGLVGTPLEVAAPTACLSPGIACDDSGWAVHGAVQAGLSARTGTKRVRAGAEAFAGPLVVTGVGLNPNRVGLVPLVDLAATLSAHLDSGLGAVLRLEAEPLTASFGADLSAERVVLPPLRAGLALVVPVGTAR